MNKIFPYLFAFAILFFLYAVYLNVKPLIIKQLESRYIIEQIQVSGLNHKNPKKVLEIFKKENKGEKNSLLTLNEKKYVSKIEDVFDDIHVVEIIKDYPNILYIILSEKDPLLLIKMRNYFFGVDQKGKLIVYNSQSDILSYDKIIINLDVSLSLKNEIVKSTKKEKKQFLLENVYLQQLINSFINFPTEEKDWFQQISNIDLNRKILYTRDGFQIELEDFSMSNFRRARYSYVYLKERKSSVKIYIGKKIIKYATKY